MIKAVFFDIDGTLVPIGEHSIPESTRRAIAQMRRNGIKVFIATGRHPMWIDNLGDTEFDGYVTTNGALCFLGDCRTEIYRRVIDPADIERLVEFDRRKPMSFVIVPADGGGFVTEKNDNFNHACRMLNIPFVPQKPVQAAVGQPVVQMMVFASGKEIEESGLFRHALHDCEPTSWCDWFADIVPKGSDKSVGIDRMIEHFGITLDETMAFGDGGNDIGMLRHAGIGVALGQASDEVKGAADYVTAPVGDNGVVKALRHFRLID